MIKLFTPYELFVDSVKLIENLLYSRLETCLEVILQLTYVTYPIEFEKKMSLKIKAKLFEDKQNFLVFFCLGTRKTLSLGEFDEF